MKRLLAALLTFFALLALTGCGGSSSDGPHLLLYYPAPSGGSPGGDAIVSRSVDWAANSTLPAEQQVRRVVSLLLEDSADGSLESPIPASTRLLACQVSDGAAWVDFSSAYGQLSGMELTIADYCVTLSLSQIVGIYSVRITVNGTGLVYRDSNIFLAGDVLMTSQDDVVQNLALRLYFPDRETGELTAEERLLTVNIPEIETSLRKAAEVHKEARSYIQNRIKPGIRFWDMCCDLEDKVRFLIGENGPNVCDMNGVQCRLAWGSRRAAPLITLPPTTRRTRTTCRDCSTAT